VPGAAPPLDAHQWSVLGLVLIAEISAQFASSHLVLALPQIQAGLSVPEDQVAALNANVRLGMVFTMAVTAFAYRFGRRRLLLALTTGLCIATALAGLAPNADVYVAVQIVARVFTGGAFVLGAVVITEEFSASARGWGLGALSLIGGLGYATSALLFAFVDVLPLGWRGLHLLTLVPLLLLPAVARRLGETARYEQSARMRPTRPERAFLRTALAPVARIVRDHPGRMAAIGVFAIGLEVVTWPAFSLFSKHLQDHGGYSPAGVAQLFVAGGTVGIVGNVVAGRMGDRFGRRPVAVALLIAMTGACLAVYRVSGWVLPVAWAGFVFTLTGLNLLLTALASELFPTSARSTSAGFRMSMASLGGVLGFAIEGALYDGSHADAVILMLPAVVFPIVAVLCLPESAGRELEEVAPDLP